MAVPEHAPLDLHASSGNRIFPHGHCVLFESLPEPPRIYLADRSFPVAHGVFAGSHRDYPPVGLEVLLVFRDMDGLHPDMDGRRRVAQGAIAVCLHAQTGLFYPYTGHSVNACRFPVFSFQNDQKIRDIGASVNGMGVIETMANEKTEIIMEPKYAPPYPQSFYAFWPKHAINAGSLISAILL